MKRDDKDSMAWDSVDMKVFLFGKQRHPVDRYTEIERYEYSRSNFSGQFQSNPIRKLNPILMHLSSIQFDSSQVKSTPKSLKKASALVY